jgi:hypothetical protein
LKRRVREVGASGIIHGNSGRHPSGFTSEELRRRIITLKKSTRYKATDFTHFRELSEERENISIGYTTLSSILRGAGIESKKSPSQRWEEVREKEAP